MRAIIFLLLVILVFLVVRFTINRIIEIREQQKREAINKAEKHQAESPSQEMVRCALCGVHVPQSEAYYDGKDTFCSEGHMAKFHDQQQ